MALLGVCSSLCRWSCAVAVPELTAVPDRKLAVHAGSTQTLSCTGRAVPTPTLTWLRNGVEVRNGSLANVFIVERVMATSFTTESVLVVEIAAPSHQGNFTCTATNDYGEDLATSFLSVLTGDSSYICSY